MPQRWSITIRFYWNKRRLRTFVSWFYETTTFKVNSKNIQLVDVFVRLAFRLMYFRISVREYLCLYTIRRGHCDCLSLEFTGCGRPHGTRASKYSCPRLFLCLCLMELPKQFDNITSRLIDDLRNTLAPKAKVSVAAASFSIYAYEALKEQLEQIEELQFIFTSPTFNKEHEKKQKREFYIPKLNRERTLYGSDFEIKLRTQLSQKAIAREFTDRIGYYY